MTKALVSTLLPADPHAIEHLVGDGGPVVQFAVMAFALNVVANKPPYRAPGHHVARKMSLSRQARATDAVRCGTAGVPRSNPLYWSSCRRPKRLRR
jgi:hypothetical protein